MYRRRQQNRAVFMAANIGHPASTPKLSALELFGNTPKLTDEEFAEFEQALDRKQ